MADVNKMYDKILDIEEDLKNIGKKLSELVELAKEFKGPIGDNLPVRIVEMAKRLKMLIDDDDVYSIKGILSYLDNLPLSVIRQFSSEDFQLLDNLDDLDDPLKVYDDYDKELQKNGVEYEPKFKIKKENSVGDEGVSAIKKALDETKKETNESIEKVKENLNLNKKNKFSLAAMKESFKEPSDFDSFTYSVMRKPLLHEGVTYMDKVKREAEEYENFEEFDYSNRGNKLKESKNVNNINSFSLKNIPLDNTPFITQLDVEQFFDF